MMHAKAPKEDTMTPELMRLSAGRLVGKKLPRDMYNRSRPVNWNGKERE